MTDDTYNGWANRATWLVNLHLGNTEWLYNQAREVAEISDADRRKAGRNEFAEDKDRMARYYADERFRDWVHDLITDHTDSAADLMSETSAVILLIEDLIGTALADVDWRSVREALEPEVVGKP